MRTSLHLSNSGFMLLKNLQKRFHAFLLKMHSYNPDYHRCSQPTANSEQLTFSKLCTKSCGIFLFNGAFSLRQTADGFHTVRAVNCQLKAVCSLIKIKNNIHDAIVSQP